MKDLTEIKQLLSFWLEFSSYFYHLELFVIQRLLPDTFNSSYVFCEPVKFVLI